MKLALYLAFLGKGRDRVGAVAMVKNVASTICYLNGHAADAYDTAKVNATIETVKRRNRRRIKKAAGLTPNMTSAIIRKYGYPRQERRPEHQWEMAIGVAVAVGFKILRHYDDLVRARCDNGYCEVLEPHVRFYLDGRKSNKYDRQAREGEGHLRPGCRRQGPVPIRACPAYHQRRYRCSASRTANAA